MQRKKRDFPLLAEPRDYFAGVGRGALPVPTDVLLFTRSTRATLQQRALQNRSHHRFVLAFNLETEGAVHVDNLVHRFKPGQALLILPYQFHHFSQLASERLRWLFCTFECAQPAFLEPLRNRRLTSSRETDEARDALLAAWVEGEGTQWKDELREGLLQVALMRLLLCLELDLKHALPDPPPQSRGDLLRTVNRFMSESQGRPVAVKDVARGMGVSTPWLRAEFRRAAGIPVGRYLLNYRLNRAMALLRTTDLPVAEIAAEAGFGSPQAFSRVFRCKLGKPPRAYRNAAADRSAFRSGGESR